MSDVSEAIPASSGVGVSSPVAAAELRPAGRPMTRSQRVAVLDPTGELPDDVQRFMAIFAGDELCLNRDWFDLLIRYSPAAGQKPRLYVVRAEDEDRIDCLLFAMSNSDGSRPRKLSSLTNFYTMSYAPLIRRDLADQRSCLDALASFIVREEPVWDLIELHCFIEESATTGEWVRALRQAGLIVGTFAEFENWFYPCEGVSAEQYFATRPPPVRAITRKMRQAQKKHALSFQLYDSARDIETGLQDYERVYANSWKGAEGFPEFVPQLIRCYAAQGKLRLGILRLDDVPGAAQLWLITGRRATIYKVAYDEKFAPLSVGSLLSKFIFDHVLDHDKVSEIDYGVGSERYKLDWMSECRHIVGIVCFNPRSSAGLAAAARHFSGRWWRRLRGKGEE